MSSTLILGWWTSRTIPGFNDGKYMALYAGVGGSAAVFSFISAFTFRYYIRILKPMETD